MTGHAVNEGKDGNWIISLCVLIVSPRQEVEPLVGKMHSIIWGMYFVCCHYVYCPGYSEL